MNRNKLEISYVLLNLSIHPTKIRELMKLGNINYKTACHYVSEMIEKKLIKSNINIMPNFSTTTPRLEQGLYQTTDKGLLFIKKWKELKILLMNDI